VGSQWAQPSATHLRYLMRKVYSDPVAAAAKGMAGRRHIQKHFTPEVRSPRLRLQRLRLRPLWLPPADS
jgi:hypothetical protein